MKKTITQILVDGGVGVMATDTLYGLVGSTDKPKTIERLYALRRRTPTKPFIILLADGKDIARFGISWNSGVGKKAQSYWPGKVSVVLPLPRAVLQKFSYLHRGKKTLAFRVPQKKNLRTLLAKTGPLAAPSANTEGAPPATTIARAKKYFGKEVDFYVDAGTRISAPSTLIDLSGDVPIILRCEKKIIP